MVQYTEIYRVVLAMYIAHFKHTLLTNESMLSGIIKKHYIVMKKKTETIFF